MSKTKARALVEAMVLVLASGGLLSCAVAIDRVREPSAKLVKESKELGLAAEMNPRCIGGSAPEACLQPEAREGLEHLISSRHSKLAQCFQPLLKRWQKQHCSDAEARSRWEKALAETEDPALRNAMVEAFEARQGRRPESLVVKVRIELIISEQAKVTQVDTIDISPLDQVDQRFKTCVERQFLRQNVTPGPRGGSVIFSVPLVFTGQ